jgi:release factor glutamine methyltransferase
MSEDSPRPETVAAVTARAAAVLAGAGIPEPRLEADLLLACLLDVDRGSLVALRPDAVNAEVAARYTEWVERRCRREPLQHITGVQEFYGLSFQVDGRVLIPRPETEGLVEATVALDLPNRARVADLGVGSGCIAVALAVTRRDLELYALDRSEDALELARDNARRHEVEDRIEFRRGELEAPPEEWWERMDTVVSNPPYVRADEWARLEPEVRDHDPQGALVAGPTGLEAYQALIPSAFDLLRPEGYLVLELGFGQAEDVRDIALASGFRAHEIRPDMQQIPRVLVAERP